MSCPTLLRLGSLFPSSLLYKEPLCNLSTQYNVVYWLLLYFRSSLLPTILTVLIWFWFICFWRFVFYLWGFVLLERRGSWRETIVFNLFGFDMLWIFGSICFCHFWHFVFYLWGFGDILILGLILREILGDILILGLILHEILGDILICLVLILHGIFQALFSSVGMERDKRDNKERCEEIKKIKNKLDKKANNFFNNRPAKKNGPNT